MLHFGLSHLQNVNFNLGIPDIYFSFNAFHLFLLLFTDIRNTYFFFCLRIKLFKNKILRIFMAISFIHSCYIKCETVSAAKLFALHF